MVRAVVWTILLYSAIKFARMMFLSSGGFRRDHVSWTDRARLNEPGLLIACTLLATSTALYSQWWVHRWASRGVEHATTCVGQLGAADALPGIYARFRRQDISARGSGYFSMAIDQGAHLGLASKQVGAIASDKRASWRAYYAALFARDDRRGIARQIAAIRRCLNDEWAPHGEILNP